MGLEQSSEQELVSVQTTNTKQVHKSFEMSLQDTTEMEKNVEVLRTIFNMMDSDNDGYISPDHFELSDIPTEMLEHLEAILFEVHQQNCPTDFAGFVKIVNKYGLFEELQKVKFKKVD